MIGAAVVAAALPAAAQGRGPMGSCLPVGAAPPGSYSGTLVGHLAGTGPIGAMSVDLEGTLTAVVDPPPAAGAGGQVAAGALRVTGGTLRATMREQNTSVAASTEATGSGPIVGGDAVDATDGAEFRARATLSIESRTTVAGQARATALNRGIGLSFRVRPGCTSIDGSLTIDLGDDFRSMGFVLIPGESTYQLANTTSGLQAKLDQVRDRVNAVPGTTMEELTNGAQPILDWIDTQPAGERHCLALAFDGALGRRLDARSREIRRALRQVSARYGRGAPAGADPAADYALLMPLARELIAIDRWRRLRACGADGDLTETAGELSRLARALRRRRLWAAAWELDRQLCLLGADTQAGEILEAQADAARADAQQAARDAFDRLVEARARGADAEALHRLAQDALAAQRVAQEHGRYRDPRGGVADYCRATPDGC